MEALSFIAGLSEPQRRPDLILVNSPINDYNRIPRPDTEQLPAFGLAHIATECEAAGFNVGVLDVESLGLTPEQAAKILNEVSPRWVGINMLTPTFQLARRIIINLKPEILVAGGAAHAKALPERVLRDPLIGKKIRVLALEDGEFITRALLSDTYPEEMEGVAYLDKHGEFVLKPYGITDTWIPRDLNSLHFADRKFLPSDPFVSQGRLETNMVGSRGCPFNCSFCSGAREMLLGGVRHRSPGNMVDEQIMLRDHGINAVRFIDDLFLANKKRMEGYFRRIIDTNLHKDFVWDATARVNTLAKLDLGTLEMMAISGCREISIGVESASPRVLNIMDKAITVNMVTETVENLARVGIRMKGYFILGTPSETREEMESTVELMHTLRRRTREIARKHPITPQGLDNHSQFRGSMFEFRPYPGTPLYEYITGKRPWPEGIWKNLSEAIHYSEDEILNSFRPVFMDGLEERQKHNYTTDHPLTNVMPFEIQELIAEAMLVQRDDMHLHGEYLPGLRTASSDQFSSREVESI